MNKPQGGAAFPRPATIHPDSGRILIPGVDGMSLRDYFAAKAAQGICASAVDASNDADRVARESYGIADAMLKIRGG